MTKIFLSILFFGLLTCCSSDNQAKKSLLGTWSSKNGDMTLIIKEDKIADTEYFGSFEYTIKGDSITIFYETPLKYKLKVDKETLTLLSAKEKRKYYKGEHY